MTEGPSLPVAAKSEQESKSISTFSLTGSNFNIDRIKAKFIEHGIPIAHADTDSIFVKLENPTSEQLEVIKEINDEMNPLNESIDPWSIESFFFPHHSFLGPFVYPRMLYHSPYIRDTTSTEDLRRHLGTLSAGGTVPNDVVRGLIEKELSRRT